MKNMDDYRFQKELEYQLALLESIRKLLLVYEKFYQEETKGDMLPRIGGSILSHQELNRTLQKSHPEFWNHKKEALQELSRIRECGKKSMREKGIVIAMEYVIHAFGLTDFEAFLLILAWASQMDHETGLAVSAMCEYQGEKGPTIHFCARLYALEEVETIEIKRKCLSRKELLSWLFAGTEAGQRGESLLEKGLHLDDRIFVYLQDYGSLDDELKMYVDYTYHPEPKLWIQQEIQTGISRSIRQKKRIFLFGEQGSGKKYQVAAFCQTFGREILLVRGNALPDTLCELSRLVQRLKRETVLRGNAILCFADLPEDGGISEHLLQELGEWEEPVFFTSVFKNPTKQHDNRSQTIYMEIPKTTTEERLILWKHVLKEEQIPDAFDLLFLSDKYQLTPGAIVISAEEYENRLKMEGKKAEAKWILEACRNRLEHSLGDDAVRIQAQYQWDDLVLPAFQKKMLQDACDQVMCHHQVYHQWKFEEKIAYGRGVSMIFYGPPGTGKTMAAQVMANRLGMELYKVDMAGVMSKYIGESEKKLGNIFRQAAKSQSILFFDEADALFGKRTEQRDSNDKYANASTAYLLQKIEEYEGVMILATNLLQNFDSAFLRRFKYVIEFPFTDITRRRKIWEHVFPAEVPREMLDVEFLAEEYKFSGSQIKNVAVAAAFLAAAKKEKVTMKHVLTGVKRELAKTGKQMIASDFGPYYYLMEEQEE